MGPARPRRSPQAGRRATRRPFRRQRFCLCLVSLGPEEKFEPQRVGVRVMATPSAAQRAARELVRRLGPKQLSLLPGSPATVTYTGKAGRPKGRKNDATLAQEAGLDVWGEKLLTEGIATALIDPIAEAKKRVAAIYLLDPDADPNTIVERDLNGDGDPINIVTFGDLVLEVSKHFDGLKATERKAALPFVRKKMPQEVDVTERHLVEIRQYAMDDDGLGDPAARAKNVTPAKAPRDEDGLP